MRKLAGAPALLSRSMGNTLIDLGLVDKCFNPATGKHMGEDHGPMKYYELNSAGRKSVVRLWPHLKDKVNV